MYVGVVVWGAGLPLEALLERRDPREFTPPVSELLRLPFHAAAVAPCSWNCHKMNCLWSCMYHKELNTPESRPPKLARALQDTTQQPASACLPYLVVAVSRRGLQNLISRLAGRGRGAVQHAGVQLNGAVHSCTTRQRRQQGIFC